MRLLTNLLIGGLAIAPSAYALSWDSLWKRSDQQQQAAIDAYHHGNYQAALEGFSLDKTATGAFNRGNALARSEQLEAAIDAYDSALDLQPDFEDAKYNRKLVEEALAQQQQNEHELPANAEQTSDEPGEDEGTQQQFSQSDQGSRGQGDPQSDANSGTDSESPAGISNDESDQAADAGEKQEFAEQDEQASAAQKSSEAASAQADEKQQGDAAMAQAAEGRMDEDAQALELILRQVPDDPGALLRQKFKYQYQNQ